MRLRSRDHESRKVSEIAAWLAGAWATSNASFPKLSKAHDLPISAEMPSERIFVGGLPQEGGFSTKTHSIWRAQGPGRDRWTLPAIGFEWNLRAGTPPKTL